MNLTTNRGGFYRISIIEKHRSTIKWRFLKFNNEVVNKLNLGAGYLSIDESLATSFYFRNINLIKR